MAQVEAKSTGGGGTATRPMTGEEYRESLRDGREIWIHGERVEDVTTHPAFRNGVRSIGNVASTQSSTIL